MKIVERLRLCAPRDEYAKLTLKKLKAQVDEQQNEHDHQHEAKDVDHTSDDAYSPTKKESKNHPSNDPDKLFSCEICSSTFKRSHDLKRHLRSLHTNARPFQCFTCPKFFARMDALKRHISREGNKCYVDLTVGGMAKLHDMVKEFESERDERERLQNLNEAHDKEFENDEQDNIIYG